MSSPFMQLYVADYLGDTRHLTTEQHGAYLLLLMTLWRCDGELQADDAKLARVAGLTLTRWNKIKGDVMALMQIVEGKISNKRLLAELKKAKEKSQKRASAGSAGGTAKALKDKEPALANATVLPQHSSEPEPEPEPESKKEEVGAGAASQAPLPPLVPIIEIPTNRFNSAAEQFPVYGGMCKEYQRLYPAVDVEAELRKMRGWSLANPTKCKTKRGMKAFINGWLARQQDKPAPRETFQGGRNGGQPAHQSFGATLSRVVSERDEGRGLFGSSGGQVIDADPVRDRAGTGEAPQIPWRAPDAA